MPISNSDIPQGSESVKSFQLTTDTASKSDPKYGKELAKYIASTVFSGIGNGYFWLRNSRYLLNRQMAAGKMDTSVWRDRLQLNGKINFLNLNLQPLKIVNTIISKMVGRWMGRSEKVQVSATDPLSLKDKEEQFQQAEFILHNRQQLQQLQQASGVQMIPKNQFVPNDQDELDLWMAEYNRIPEEILYEKGINESFAANGLFDVVKEQLLHDSAEVGFVGLETYMNEQGVIVNEWVKPENAFYSYSEFNDLRDTTWRGRVKAMKLSELRKKYGKEFGGKLSEEELWQIAQSAKEYQLNDKLRWLVEWNVSILRPYDEWNVDVMIFEFKTVDSDPYTLVQTKKNKSTFLKKGKPQKLDSNEEYVEDNNENIYRGVYIRQTDTLLEWGLKTNMIRPQDPKNSGQAEFSFSFYMYQNQDMRNIAVPEKIQRPAEQMQLACFKIEQTIMKLRPLGASINVDAMQELDLGLADLSKPIDVQKIYDQTGNLYYRGRDAEGNVIPEPIKELQNAGFIAQLQGLVQDYQFHYQCLKDELGEDPNLMAAASKPRVAVQNIDTAVQQADNATDYMYDAYLYVLEQASRKTACLLHDSVTFGASAYRHIMSEQDVQSRVFGTEMRMLPTDQEISVLEGMMNQAIQSNPDFVMYCDPFKVTRIAKEDVKLGEWYFRNCQKKMIQAKQQQASQNAQENAQAQQQSLQMKGQMDQQIEQLKSQYESQKNMELSRAQKEQIALQGYFDCKKVGQSVPPQLEQEIITNVLLPLFAENQTNKAMLAQAMQMHQAADQKMQQALPQGQPDQGQGQPDMSQQPQQEGQQPQGGQPPQQQAA